MKKMIKSQPNLIKKGGKCLKSDEIWSEVGKKTLKIIENGYTMDKNGWKLWGKWPKIWKNCQQWLKFEQKTNEKWIKMRKKCHWKLYKDHEIMLKMVENWPKSTKVL